MEGIVTYDQALALKLLGFNTPCYGYYGEHDHAFYSTRMGTVQAHTTPEIIAPFKWQVLKYFRDIHGLHGAVVSWKIGERIEYYFSYQPIGKSTLCRCTEDVTFDTYEKAEAACISKLIEIVNTK